jgi:hypothetical protein
MPKTIRENKIVSEENIDKLENPSVTETITQ